MANVCLFFFFLRIPTCAFPGRLPSLRLSHECSGISESETVKERRSSGFFVQHMGREHVLFQSSFKKRILLAWKKKIWMLKRSFKKKKKAMQHSWVSSGPALQAITCVRSYCGLGCLLHSGMGRIGCRSADAPTGPCHHLNGRHTHQPAGDDTQALTHVVLGYSLLRARRPHATTRLWWRGGHSSFQAKQWAALPSSVLTRPLLPFQLRQIYPIWAAISPAHEVSFLSRFLSSGRFVYSICLRSECAGSEMGARLRAASSVACCDSGGFVVCSRGIGA